MINVSGHVSFMFPHLQMQGNDQLTIKLTITNKIDSVGGSQQDIIRQACSSLVCFSSSVYCCNFNLQLIRLIVGSVTYRSVNKLLYSPRINVAVDDVTHCYTESGCHKAFRAIRIKLMTHFRHLKLFYIFVFFLYFVV